MLAAWLTASGTRYEDLYRARLLSRLQFLLVFFLTRKRNPSIRAVTRNILSNIFQVSNSVLYHAAEPPQMIAAGCRQPNSTLIEGLPSSWVINEACVSRVLAAGVFLANIHHFSQSQHSTTRHHEISHSLSVGQHSRAEGDLYPEHDVAHDPVCQLPCQPLAWKHCHEAGQQATAS